MGTQLAENGRVLATLDDWRAIMFVLVGVIVVLIGLIIWDRVATARRDAKVADAMNSIAKALTRLTVEVRTMSRVVKQKASDGSV